MMHPAGLGEAAFTACARTTVLGCLLAPRGSRRQSGRYGRDAQRGDLCPRAVTETTSAQSLGGVSL